MRSMSCYSVMSRDALFSKRHYLIRRIFLEARDDYPLIEAARLLSIQLSTLAKDVRAGAIDGFERNGSWRLSWSQVAELAFQKWGLRVIIEELGEQAAVIPALAQPRALTVYLPEYQARMLNVLAADVSKSIDDYLAGHLLDLAASVADSMEARAPGFNAAMHFPMKS